jgi:hypothetical protein
MTQIRAGQIAPNALPAQATRQRPIPGRSGTVLPTTGSLAGVVHRTAALAFAQRRIDLPGYGWYKQKSITQRQPTIPELDRGCSRSAT